MVEVEVKVSVRNRVYLEEKLLEKGFLKGDLLKESDYYFDNACHEIREKDMALRIRSCENLSMNTTETFMTYKGPKLDQVSMTRKELEMKIESAEIGRDILKSLGYTEVPPVVKLRQEFHMDRMNACLDRVENLGDFLELEIVVAQENEKENALNQLILLLHELGYEREDIIRTSYLSMLQNK